MTSEVLPPLFPDEDVPVIVQDVLDCCRDLKRPAPRVKRPEEDLSKQVYQKLVKIPRYRLGPLEPHIESWLPDIMHRADIRFSCGRGIECYFLFEAKRLFVTYPKSGKKDSLLSEYIHEGMMRFVNRHYAPFQHRSAMLGYVHDEMPSSAFQMLGTALSVQSALLRGDGTLTESPLPFSSGIQETRHTLDDGLFVLFHLLVHVPPHLNAS